MTRKRGNQIVNHYVQNNTDIMITHKPVSYTHLDVYKRQEEQRRIKIYTNRVS